MVVDTKTADDPHPVLCSLMEETSEQEAALAKSSISSESKDDVIFKLEDVPPWYMSFLFGLQHFLTMASATVSIPILVASFLCLKEDDPARGALVSTVLVHSGIVTLVQTTFGIRLPVVQGTDFSYTVPIITLLTSVHPPCAELPLANMTEEARQEEWLGRIREVQGAIAAVSVFQIFLGLTGLVGVLLRWVTPLSIVPTVTLVGLALFDVSADMAASHWGIWGLTIVLMILFSQYMGHVDVPLPLLTNGKRCLTFTTARAKVFRCFPLLMAIFVSWGVCAVLTACDMLPPGSAARTDATENLLQKAPWFFVPYPGQWGWPRVTAAGVVGMAGACVASIIESIGDYYACARISGAPPPPTNAINRAVAVEGLGSLLAGLLGTGSGTTSCSQNIGVISVTKVASRRVIQFSAFILIASGLFGKFGAAFVAIPEPVMAGVLTVVFAMIIAVGLLPIQNINLSSSRNLFILGFSIFFGLSIPKWLTRHPGQIQTGSEAADQILTVLLRTPMMVGGIIGCFLDNTIPGSVEERGVMERNRPSQEKETDEYSNLCYDLPWVTPCIRRVSWMRLLPFSPTYQSKSGDLPLVR